MVGFRNPFSQPKDEPETSDADAALAAATEPPSPAPILVPEPVLAPLQDVEAAEHHVYTHTPTDKLTAHQFFYIFIIDGIGAMILSGGINFAIAYAMYTTQDTERHPIRLFQLPNTLAGDAAVTIIIQSLITWLIELALVSRDIRVGGVSPIGFLRPPTTPFLRRLFFLDSHAHGASPGPSLSHVPLFLLENAARAMSTAVVAFVVLWPISVGALTAVGTRSGGDWVFHPVWAPQVFKLVLGGVLALLQTPVFASFWLVREGWVILEQVNGVHGGEGQG